MFSNRLKEVPFKIVNFGLQKCGCTFLALRLRRRSGVFCAVVQYCNLNPNLYVRRLVHLIQAEARLTERRGASNESFGLGRNLGFWACQAPTGRCVFGRDFSLCSVVEVARPKLTDQASNPVNSYMMDTMQMNDWLAPMVQRWQFFSKL